jgi:ribosomal protein S18 acetylase RimI-like enzyme
VFGGIQERSLPVNITYEEMAFEKRAEQSLQDIAAINHLLAQLSSRAPEVDLHTIVRVLHDGPIVIARDGDIGGRLVGMGTILFAHKLTAAFATIEDVVVDERYRGCGIGASITARLIEKAKERQVAYVDLTSSPRRVAANALYRKLGFVARETNPFRLELTIKPDAARQESSRAASG